jgi:hypothetical protein
MMVVWTELFVQLEKEEVEVHAPLIQKCQTLNVSKHQHSMRRNVQVYVLRHVTKIYLIVIVEQPHVFVVLGTLVISVRLIYVVPQDVVDMELALLSTLVVIFQSVWMLVSVSHLGLDLCVIKIYVLLIPYCTNHAVEKGHVFIQVTMTQDVSATKVTLESTVRTRVMESVLVMVVSFHMDVQGVQMSILMLSNVDHKVDVVIHKQKVVWIRIGVPILVVQMKKIVIYQSVSRKMIVVLLPSIIVLLGCVIRDCLDQMEHRVIRNHGASARMGSVW